MAVTMCDGTDTPFTTWQLLCVKDSITMCEVSKFADDTKVGKIIRTDQDATELQGDLDRLYDWARKWQIEFNP